MALRLPPNGPFDGWPKWASALLLLLSACDSEQRAVTPEEPAEGAWLHATRGDEAHVFPVGDNSPIELEHTSFQVDAVRPWRGLVGRSTGIALLHFSVLKPDGTALNDLVLKDRDRIRIDDALTVAFAWAPDSATADQIASEPESGGRWGLRESSSTSWSDSFQPGTGFERQDGATIALMNTDTGTGAITISFRHGKDSRVETVAAGGASSDGVVNERTVPAAAFVRVVASPNDNVLIAATTTRVSQEVRVARYDYFQIPGTEYGLVVHEARADSVYVAPEQSPWLEAVLDADDREYHLREGVSERFHDWTLLLSRTPEISAPETQHAGP